MSPKSVLILSASAFLVASHCVEAQRNMRKDHRLGFIAIKFDDGSAGHYTNAFPILSRYGLKGVFCVNAGSFAEQPGGTKITAHQCTEMDEAGHEIVDHTLDHKSAIWGNAGNVEEWTKRTEESLRILNALGIKARGWNLPGGKGSVYNKALHDLMPNYYEYARGGNCDLGYRPFHLCWNFKGDPYGYRGIYGSWESYVDGYDGKATREEALAALGRLKTTRADLLQRGVLVGFTFHRIVEANQAKWALGEFCRWIAENELPNATIGEAFDAFVNPRWHYPEDIEQIPCCRFQYDLDNNGRPDGWQKCSFAPSEIKSPGEGRVAEFQHGANTLLFGPEPGSTKVSFVVKSAGGMPQSVKLGITGVEIMKRFERSKAMKLVEAEVQAGNEWQQLGATFDVSPRTESCGIQFSIGEGGRVYVACPSWRRDVRKQKQGP